MVRVPARALLAAALLAGALRAEHPTSNVPPPPPPPPPPAETTPETPPASTPEASEPASGPETSAAAVEPASGPAPAAVRAPEPPADPNAPPTPTEVMDAMAEVIRRDQALKGGYFFLRDAATKQVRALKHMKVHDAVAVIEGPMARKILARIQGGNPEALPGDDDRVYFSCNDFEDARSKDVVDVDVWMVRGFGIFQPVQYAIHKVNGEARFVYQDNEAVPLAAGGAAKGVK